MNAEVSSKMWSELFNTEKNLKGILGNNERSNLMASKACDALVDIEHIAVLVT